MRCNNDIFHRRQARWNFMYRHFALKGKRTYRSPSISLTLVKDVN